MSAKKPQAPPPKKPVRTARMRMIAEAERDAARAQVETLLLAYERLGQNLAAARAANLRLREALEIFADRENWYTWTWKPDRHGWEVARAALAAGEGGVDGEDNRT